MSGARAGNGTESQMVARRQPQSARAMGDAGAATTAINYRIRMSGSIVRSFADGGKDVRRLRKNRVLQIGRIRNRRVESTNSSDWSIEIFEEFSSDTRGDLRAKAARQLILVSDDHAIDALDVRGNAGPIVGSDRAQIEDGHADSFLLCLMCGHNRSLDQRAPRHEQHIGSILAEASLPE